MRHNQRRYVDYDGDGALDLVTGIEDWSFYGWDDAWNEQGEWVNGPLHGFVVWHRNTGTSAEPQYAPPTKVEAGGKLGDGGVILWGDAPDAPHARFGEGLGNPYTCLTRAGLLVAAADGVLEVYDTRDTKLSLLAMKTEPSFQPRGLVATGHSEHFAMLMEDGTVLVHSLEARR